MVEVRGTRLERWGISFSTPTFGFSTFVESIAKRLRNVDEFAEYRSTSRILLFFSSFPFTNVRPLFPSSNAGQKSSSSVRCRNFDSAPCTRKKGDRMGDIFPGSWVMQHTSTARSQYISGMHGAFHDKIFQYWHPVSIYWAAREIRRAVGTYLYEFHFGWLYSALLPQRSPAKRPKRGGTHFDVHVLRFR